MPDAAAAPGPRLTGDGPALGDLWLKRSIFDSNVPFWGNWPLVGALVRKSSKSNESAHFGSSQPLVLD
jgi:hypothetical protein